MNRSAGQLPPSAQPAARRVLRLRRLRRTLLEGLLAANLLFLALDIVFAHSVNAFRDPLEWLPLGFSLAGGGVLAALLASGRGPEAQASRIGGGIVGVFSIGVGIWGAIAHLESAFFRSYTLESLVYAAPFVAPLAYAGIGFLLLVNRGRGFRPSGEDFGWGQRVTAFAAAGFAGNFVLSLLDHEQNGFFSRTEWIPVAAAALAFSSLFVISRRDRPNRSLVCWTAMVLGLQIGVGILGFALHLQAGFRSTSGSLFEVLVHGAPPFAPLLFCDLALLAGLGLLALPPGAKQGVEARRRRFP